MKRHSTREDQVLGYAMRSLFEAFSACKKVDWRKVDIGARTNAAALARLAVDRIEGEGRRTEDGGQVQ